jgi:hypothetical protein
MKEVEYKDLVNQTIVAVDESVIYRVIVTTIDANEFLHYYLIEGESSIFSPLIHELTYVEAQRYLQASTTHNN